MNLFSSPGAGNGSQEVMKTASMSHTQYKVRHIGAQARILRL